MISRRTFTIGGAAAFATIKRVDAQASVGMLQAWAMPTGATEGLPPGYPLDHTAVVSVRSKIEWGCFGGVPSDNRPGTRMIAQAPGDELWAAAIAGPDGHAGIDLDVTGACQQCSNRILLPAMIDVDRAYGNEIATPLFGKYGFGGPELVVRIKDAALAVNRQHPGRITERMVSRAVDHVRVNSSEEWQVIEAYLASLFKAPLGTRWPECRADLLHTYLALYNYRTALYSQYAKGRIAKPDFIAHLRTALNGAIELVTEIVTPVRITPAFALPAAVQVAFVFNNR